MSPTSPVGDAHRGAGLLHNSGGCPSARIVWRGLDREPGGGSVDAIRAARHAAGSWLVLQARLEGRRETTPRDWNSAAALLAVLCPDHGLDEAAAERELRARIEAHAARLGWPRVLLVDSQGQGGTRPVDHPLATFTVLAKSTGAVWLAERAASLAPLCAPAVGDAGTLSRRTVTWSAAVWFPGGIRDELLAQLRAKKT
jgi:hypothetical protein